MEINICRDRLPTAIMAKKIKNELKELSWMQL